ncbi:MAG: hypothetical protein ACYCZJ_12805 [Sulfuriferula sp.]
MSVFIAKAFPRNQEEICVEIVCDTLKTSEAKQRFIMFLGERYPALETDGLEMSFDLKP